MRIDAELLAEMVEHAQMEAPIECCGLVGFQRHTPILVKPTENVLGSYHGFKINDEDYYKIFMMLKEIGMYVGATYHSHTFSDPYPSATDIDNADPTLLNFIVGTAQEPPWVRCFLIEDGVVTEIELDVVGRPAT